MRGVALVLLALLTRAPKYHHASPYLGKHSNDSLSVVKALQADKGFSGHEYRDINREKYRRCFLTELCKALCVVEACKVNTVLLQGVYSECSCMRVHRSRNWQALTGPLISEQGKTIQRLHLVFHLSGSFYLGFCHVFSIFMRNMGSKNIWLMALHQLIQKNLPIQRNTNETNCLCLSYVTIFTTGERWINLTVKLWLITEALIRSSSFRGKAIVPYRQAGFTILELTSLTESLLTLKLLDRAKPALFGIFWKDMFYCSPSASAYVPAPLFCGCPLMHAPYKQTDESQRTATSFNTNLPAYKNIRCQKVATEDVPHLLKSSKGTMDVQLTVMSLFLLCLTAVIIFISYQQRHTPSRSSSNTKISFLLLLTISRCSTCPLTVTVQPSRSSCKVHHTVFRITFVLCISCVLGKTIVVLMAFRATLPGSNVMKWLGLPQQRLSVLAFTLIQVHTWVFWLILNFSFFNMNINQNLERGFGSATDLWPVIYWLRLQAAFYFLMAFLARKALFTMAFYLSFHLHDSMDSIYQ